jgi:hypothetical protein
MIPSRYPLRSTVHQCPDWDFAFIRPGDECCCCVAEDGRPSGEEADEDGRRPLQ